jgi:hypothetical protein
MSSQSTAGMGNSIKDALKVIMLRLNAIEQKMEPLQPLQVKVAELEVAMTDHDLHCQEQQDVVNYVESAQSVPGASCPPPHGHHVPDDADPGDLAIDPIPMAHKLEFPNSMVPVAHYHG